MGNRDYGTDSATVVGPNTQIAAQPGADLTVLAKKYAGTQATILLQGNNFASPYIWDPGSQPAGTFLGGIKFKGPCSPTRKTFAGVTGAATQLTAAQLAADSAVIQVKSGPTVNYSAGSAGYGYDQLEFEDCVLYGPTVPANENWGFDTSAIITFRRVKVIDFVGAGIKYCSRFVDDGNIYCQSSVFSTVTDLSGLLVTSPVVYTTGPDGQSHLYIISGGSGVTILLDGVSQGATFNGVLAPGHVLNIAWTVTAPTTFKASGAMQWYIFAAGYYTALNCPIYDYFNNLHFFIGANGPVAANVGQYFDYEVSGGIEFNPSGLYTQDVGFDLEFGPTQGLRSFVFDWIKATNIKAIGYVSKVFKVRGSLIVHHVTRAYGAAPGNVPTGPPSVISSAGYTDPNSLPLISCPDLEIGTIVHTEEATSNPLYTSQGIITQTNYAWMGKWRIRNLFAVVNVAGLGAQSGNLPAFVRFVSPAQGSANTAASYLAVENFELGFTVSGNPTTAIAALSFGQGSGTGPTTFGTCRLGRFKLLSGSQIAQTWAPTTTVDFVVAVEATYQITGAGVTAISINGTATGVTTGAWHLQIGDKINVTFTGSPTFNYYPGGDEPLTVGDGSNALLAAVVKYGAAATTSTITDEEVGVIDISAAAANAVTAKRVTAGTLTTTRRKWLGVAPADAADTIADAVGSGTFTYTHGSTALVTKGTPADGPAWVIVKGGTFSNMTLNGGVVAVAAIAAGIPVFMEIGDVLVLTQTANPTSIVCLSERRLGS